MEAESFTPINNKRVCLIVFTSFETKEKTIEILKKDTPDWFLMGREECPTTKKIHFQGMAWKKKSGRWTHLRESRMWMAKCIDGPAALKYCTKDGNITEVGVQPNIHVIGRPAVSVEDFLEWKEEDLISLSAQTYIQVKKALAEHRRSKKKVKSACPFTPHPWQKQIVEEMKVIEERKIVFIVDQVGCSGKTKFFGWLGTNPGFQYLSIGKKEDILNMIDMNAHTLIMDVARSETGFLNYSTLEKIKDGYWISGKYEGRICSSGTTNVLVCMNHFPDYEALSKDRYKVYEVVDLKFVERSYGYIV